MFFNFIMTVRPSGFTYGRDFFFLSLTSVYSTSCFLLHRSQLICFAVTVRPGEMNYETLIPLLSSWVEGYLPLVFLVGALTLARITLILTWLLGHGLRTHILPVFVSSVDLIQRFGTWAGMCMFDIVFFISLQERCKITFVLCPC